VEWENWRVSWVVCFLSGINKGNIREEINKEIGVVNQKANINPEKPNMGVTRRDY
jgi:hypothetical protein